MQQETGAVGGGLTGVAAIRRAVHTLPDGGSALSGLRLLIAISGWGTEWFLSPSHRPRDRSYPTPAWRSAPRFYSQPTPARDWQTGYRSARCLPGSSASRLSPPAVFAVRTSDLRAGGKRDGWQHQAGSETDLFHDGYPYVHTVN